MTQEVLIPTHHKNPDQIKDMVRRLRVNSPVLVCNQGDEAGETQIGDIRIVNVNDIGVSRNRNHLLDHAQGDICICVDDDCSLVDGYAQIINYFFALHPNAEFVLFNGIVTREGGRKVHDKKTKKVRSFNSVSYGGGPGLVFRRNAIKKYELRYREDIGYPNFVSFGEDSAYLKSIVDSGAVFYRSSDVLFSIDEDVDNSIYFSGVDERFLLSKGYCAKMLHPVLWRLYIHKYAKHLKHWRGNTNPYWTMVKTMKKGAHAFTSNIK